MIIITITKRLGNKYDNIRSIVYRYACVLNYVHCTHNYIMFIVRSVRGAAQWNVISVNVVLHPPPIYLPLSTEYRLVTTCHLGTWQSTLSVGIVPTKHLTTQRKINVVTSYLREVGGGRQCVVVVSSDIVIVVKIGGVESTNVRIIIFQSTAVQRW